MKPGYSYSDFQDGIFNVMPSMLIDFANGCRVDSGYRLLQRCLRHAFDTKAEPLLNKKASLILVGDSKVGITLQNNISASMRDSMYDVEVCITHNELLACRCNCKCGCAGDNRVACVYVLPVLYQFTLLQHEGLAQHILIELCERWNTTLEDLIGDKKKSVMMDIETLMRVEGDNNDRIELAIKKETIGEMLETFAVGTERKKLVISNIPDPS